MISCLLRISRHTRTRNILLLVSLFTVLLFQPTAALGTEAAAESISTAKTKSGWLSFLISGSVGYGNYKNITRQLVDQSGSTEVDSYARTYNGEAGLEVLSFGIIFEASLTTTLDYIPDDDSVQDAECFRRRIKCVYTHHNDRVHLFPEFGYLVLVEDVLRSYMLSEKLNYYEKEYRDQGYYYGLSARVKIIPDQRDPWWVYARYTHDNLDIQADNYQLELQYGNEYSVLPDTDDVKSEIKSTYVGLGVRWSKKADGRSEWFITLGVTGAFCIF